MLKQFSELEAEDRVLQFLLGLNEGFMPIREQILSSNKGLPSLNRILSLLQQDEKHRNFHKRKNFEVNACFVQSENFKKSQRMGRTPNMPYTDFARNGKKLNADLWCNHCERHGHTRDIYYKLVGYPNPKNKNQGDKGKAVVNSVQVTERPTVSTANNSGLIVEQIKAIQDMIGKPSSASGKNLNNFKSCLNASNFNSVIDYKNEWLLDSGASAHMSGNRKLFVSLRKTSKVIKQGCQMKGQKRLTKLAML